ncbi:hypothetical protein ACOMHN_051334 [Nucella lapillus]
MGELGQEWVSWDNNGLAGARMALSEGGGKSKTKVKGSSGQGHGKQRTCCLNGGLCVLGSFCHCPKNFHGRYCEHKVSEKPCRHIPHGSWVKAGCNLCRCVDGYMTCLPRAFDGCDDKPMTEEPQNIWDYEDQMVVFSNSETTTSKYDAEDADYYDYYDNDSSGSGKSSAGARTMANASFLALCSAVCALCRIVWWPWSLGS